MTMMESIRSFVAGLLLSDSGSRAAVTVQDCAYTLKAWIDEGFDDFPADLTPELFAATWNSLLN